tara:strand:+ start:996 stop:1220 length:225 start_codon:yes stop_codon:yes gene_type:complete
MIKSVEIDHFALGDQGAGVAFTCFPFPDLAGPPFGPSVEKLGFPRGRVISDAKEPGPFLDDRATRKRFWVPVVG